MSKAAASTTAGRPALRAVLVGFGRVNQATLGLALTRPWLEVSGIVICSPEREGAAAAADVPGAPRDLRLSTDLKGALRAAQPDVAIIATRSRLVEVYPQLETCAAAGADILCTAEELAYTEPQDGPQASAIHRLAQVQGVAVVATGVNPGFVLDLWPLCLSSVAWDVQRMRALRVVDVSVFGPAVRRSLGIGYSSAEFEAGLAEGRIAGHLGFRESLRLISRAMGRPLDDITVMTEPLFADGRIELADGAVQAGQTAGARQRAVGWLAGEPWIEVALTLHVRPKLAGLDPVDEVHIEGSHELRVRAEPGIGAIKATAAQLVNSIPLALAATPGVHGPGSLPPAAPWLSNEPPDRHRRDRAE